MTSRLIGLSHLIVRCVGAQLIGSIGLYFNINDSHGQSHGLYRNSALFSLDWGLNLSL